MTMCLHSKLRLCQSHCREALYPWVSHRNSGSPNPSSTVHNRAHYSPQQNNAQLAAASCTPHTPNTNTHPIPIAPVGTAAQITPEKDGNRRWLERKVHVKDRNDIKSNVEKERERLWAMNIMDKAKKTVWQQRQQRLEKINKLGYSCTSVCFFLLWKFDDYLGESRR